MPVELPSDDEVTLRWVIDKLPVRWWVAIIAAASALTVSGYAVATATHMQCSLTEINALRDKRDALSNEITDLEAKRSAVQAQLSRLNIGKEVSGMTREQIDAQLKAMGAMRN